MDIHGIVNQTAYIPLAGQSAGKETDGFSRLLEQAQTAETKTAGSKTIDSRTSDSRIIDKKLFNDEEKKLYETCETLETFIVKNMLNGMRKTVMKSKLIDTGLAGEIYEDMLWDEYAKDYTKKADFGLAEQAYLELAGKRGFRFTG